MLPIVTQSASKQKLAKLYTGNLTLQITLSLPKFLPSELCPINCNPISNLLISLNKNIVYIYGGHPEMAMHNIEDP